MLANFLTTNRASIIARTQARVVSRASPKPNEAELTNAIPVFVDQLGEALRLQRSTGTINQELIQQSARRHAGDLFRVGVTLARVVHDYGVVSHVITELVFEQKLPIHGREYLTLDRCVDDAIAGAVTEYVARRDRALELRGIERLSALAYDLRDLANTASPLFELIKENYVAPGSSTGLVLSRSLIGLRDLIDRSLAVVQIDAGLGRFEDIALAEFLEEVEIGAVIEAKAAGLRLAITSVDPSASLEGDRLLLAAAVSNLLQNAFKFTRAPGSVLLTVSVTVDRVRFEIEDECGGLPLGKAEDLIRSFEQQGLSSGNGVASTTEKGLFISVKTARAHAGEVRVRNLPGKGCIFTFDLPRQQPQGSPDFARTGPPEAAT